MNPHIRRFLLYTQDNPDTPDIMSYDASDLGRFDPSKQTIIVQHGWLQSGYRTGEFLAPGKHFVQIIF